MTKEQMLALIEALKMGNLDYIHELAKDNLDWLTVPLTQGQENLNALFAIHYASKHGQLNVVQYLIEKKPNLLNLTDIKNQTPILWAAANGQTPVVDFLASLGADLTISTSNLDTYCHEYQPIHWATKRGHHQVVECLIKHRAEMTVPDGNKHCYPIHIAARHGYLEIVKLLLKENPSSLALRDSRGYSPMSYAMMYGHMSVVEFLSSISAELSLELILKAFKATREQLFDKNGFTLLYDSIVQIVESSPLNIELSCEQTRYLLGLYELVARVNQTNSFFAPHSTYDLFTTSLASYLANKTHQPLHAILYARSLVWPNQIGDWYDPIMTGNELPLARSEFAIDSSGEICQLEQLVDIASNVFLEGHRDHQKIWQSNDPRRLNHILPKQLLKSLCDHFPTFNKFYHALSANSASTPLSQLQALREGLRDGSKLGSDALSKGDEFNAGSAANEAISVFALWWEDIAQVPYKKDESLRQALSKLLTGHNTGRNLGEFLEIIIRNSSANVTEDMIDARTCVQLRGDELGTAITNHIDFLSSLDNNKLTRETLVEYKKQILSELQDDTTRACTYAANNITVISPAFPQLTYFAYAVSQLWLNFCEGDVSDSLLLELGNLLKQLTDSQQQQLMSYTVDFYKDEANLESLRQYLRRLEEKLEYNALLSLEQQHKLNSIEQALLSIISSNKSLLTWVANRYEFIVFMNKPLVEQILEQGVDVTVGHIQLTLLDLFNVAYYAHLKTTNSLDSKHKREQIYHLLNFPMPSDDIMPISDLFITIQRNDIEASKQLLNDNTSFLTHVDWETGNTSLIFASICGYYDICWLLIEKGINLNLKNKQGKTAEEYWPSEVKPNPFTKLKSIFCELLSDEKLPEKRRLGLLTKLTTTHTSLLTWPIDSKGDTFLHLAFAGNHVNVINEIVQLPQWEALSLTKNIKTKSTLLSSISHAGHEALCPFLPIEQLNPSHALHNASAKGHTEFCKVMLKHGANPNICVDQNGYSSLSYAAKLKNKALCILLLEHGANPMHKNKNDKTSEALWDNNDTSNPFNEFRADLLTLAYDKTGLSKERCKNLLALILAHRHFLTWGLDNSGNTFLHAAFHANHIAVINEIVQLRQWSNLSKVKNLKNNSSLLDIIAAKGHEALCTYLPINELRRSSALLLAVQNGHEQFCKCE